MLPDHQSLQSNQQKYPMIVTKASGEQVDFEVEKLRKSLQRSGAKQEMIDAIISNVNTQLYQGISTKKIYKLAFGLLKKASKPMAARYKLKNAIMELGPSGFPFETYVAALLKHQGYNVKTGQVLNGICVTHEIDVLAEKANEVLIAECKFHNLQGLSCDVKIPLYIHSRFNDVRNFLLKDKKNQKNNYIGWVVTNTKFTSDAIQYGECVGLHLVGWNFPLNGSIKDMVDSSGLYPLTCLSTLTNREKKILLEQRFVLCMDILHKPDILNLVELTPARVENVMREVRSLIN